MRVEDCDSFTSVCAISNRPARHHVSTINSSIYDCSVPVDIDAVTGDEGIVVVVVVEEVAVAAVADEVVMCDAELVVV